MAIELVGLEREMEFRLTFDQKVDLDHQLSPGCILKMNYGLPISEVLLLNGIEKVNPSMSLEMMESESFGQISLVAHLLSFNTTMSGCGDVLLAMNTLGLKPLGWYELIHFNNHWTNDNSAAILGLGTVIAMSDWEFDIYQVPCLYGGKSLDMVSYEFEKSQRCQYLVTQNSAAFFDNILEH